MVIFVGFVFLLILGTVHYLGQRVIRVLVGRAHDTVPSAPLVAFCLLAALHLIEASLYALMFHEVALRLWPEDFGPGFDTWQDYMHLSLIAFTTLGLSDLNVMGDVRLLVAMEALGGFMELTWSATFLYETAQKTLTQN